MFQIKRPKAVALVLTLTVGTLFVTGCHRDMDPHKRADKIVGHMKKELNLTEDQTAQVHRIAYEVVDSMRPQMRTPGMQDEWSGEFLNQLRADVVDTVALNRESQERAAKMQQRMQEHRAFMIREFTELHNVLTPEQRAKLADFLQKKKEEMHEKYGSHE